MNCKNCGNKIENTNNSFCTYCGTKLDNNIENNNQPQNNINNNQNMNNNMQYNSNQNTTTFLVIGIVMAFCCSLPFGAGVILLNELKYKKELQNNQIEAAKKTKTLMIVLIVIGILSGLLLTGLQFISAFLEGLQEGIGSGY